jgi:SAM-dependent methyltransferase
MHQRMVAEGTPISKDARVFVPEAVRGPIKRRVRRAVDRLMLPYVESIRQHTCDPLSISAAEPAGPAQRPSPVDTETGHHMGVSDQFHAINHTLRGLELERLRADRKRVLSVGANGAWYFEWFRRAAGDVAEHIGIEAYIDKPDDLPDYVTWIANTADHMHDVESGSVDLVFAGQTSEHLWAHELVGFLLEAHRVLRHGGTLALDSPNRLITQHLDWSHGEHTIELDHDEIAELLRLAGFAVTEVAGIWRCVLDGELVQLEEGLDSPEVLTRRVATARDHPAESFVWWINAERSEADPEVPGLRAAVDRLFERHWNTRISRGFFADVGVDLPVAAGSRGIIAETLPFPLHAGTWEVGLRLVDGGWDGLEDLCVTILAPGGHVVYRGDLATATRDADRLSWTVEVPYVLFALVLQLAATAREPVTIGFPIEVRLT